MHVRAHTSLGNLAEHIGAFAAYLVIVLLIGCVLADAALLLFRH